MLERAGKFGSFSDVAIMIAALALAGGVVWLLADGGGSEPPAELARSSAPGPEHAAPATPSIDNEASEARADRDADPKREGRNRAHANRGPTDKTTDRRANRPSGPAPAEQVQRDRQSANDIVENLLGGKPESSPSRSELPPELSSLLRGSDDPEPSTPSPTVEEILDAASAGD